MSKEARVPIETFDDVMGMAAFAATLEGRDRLDIAVRLGKWLESHASEPIAALTAERDALRAEAMALLEDAPMPNGEYVHMPTCNASRLTPVGNSGCSCPIGRRIKALQAALREARTWIGTLGEDCARLTNRQILERIDAALPGDREEP